MKKILIVDDSAFTRTIHKQILEAEGYETVEASNGAEALEQFEAEKPDAVTMDLLMPDMDGMDVVRKIMETDSEANTIICSTDKQKFRLEEAREIGAKGFIPKPVDPETLVGLLKTIFADAPESS